MVSTIPYNGHMKKIPLTPEGYALVDDEDYAYLSGWAWHKEMLGSGEHKNPYARRGTNLYGGIKKTKAMHRLIMGNPTGKEVDHINGDTLDNRRANLRVCTRAENAKNRKINRNNTSSYKGVHRHQTGAWRSRIQVGGKRISLGLFDTPELAHAAYKRAEKEYYGEYARK